MQKIKGYLKKLYDIIVTPSMSYLPGNLAFFLVLSIFPILTLIGVIASNFSINIQSIINIIDKALPNNVVEILAGFIEGKGFDSNIGVFMIIGFFLASNGADAVILASNNLYGFPNSDYVKRRIKAIFIIIVIKQTIIKYIEYFNVLKNIKDVIASMSNFIDTIIIDILIKREKIYSDLPMTKIMSFISRFACYFITNKSHK